jgi:hypothetical protein
MTENERKAIEFRLGQVHWMIGELAGAFEDVFDTLTPEEKAEIRSRLTALGEEVDEKSRLLREAEMAG